MNVEYFIGEDESNQNIDENKPKT